MMERGFAYHDLWRDSAYALERKLPGEAIRSLRYADLQRRDRSASVEVENEPDRTHKASSSRARTYAGWAILILAALYVFAFAQVVLLVRNCSVQAILDGVNCPAPANARAC